MYKSYKEVHNPTSFESLTKSSERIAIEEYFSLISAFKYIKGGKEQIRTNKYDCSAQELLEFIVNKFPFEFTEGQKKAVNQISKIIRKIIGLRPVCSYKCRDNPSRTLALTVFQSRTLVI